MRIPLIITIITLWLPLSTQQKLYAQTYTIYYEKDKSIKNCCILSVSEFKVQVEQEWLLPGMTRTRSIDLSRITGIREDNRANKYAPYLAFLGSYLGVKYFMPEPTPWSEKSLSERFATWLDEPVHFLGSVCTGGAIGFASGFYLLGGNRELILVNKLTPEEKTKVLNQYLKTGNP